MGTEPRSTDDLTTLDALLDAEGVRETFQAIAVEEVLAWQIAQAKKLQLGDSTAKTT